MSQTLEELEQIIKEAHDQIEELEATERMAALELEYFEVTEDIRLEAEAEESLKQKIPPALYDYLDFFLKKELDTLVLHRAIDYKIKLIKENTLSFYYLNKHSLEELESMREYLSSNLTKGFVVLSKAPFTLLILFARKRNRLLQFYVDYRKLNTLTKKNQYPLLLIDETLA